jgi:hypothetical protein
MSGSYANVVGDGQAFDFSVFQGGIPTTTATTTPKPATSSPSWLNQGLGLLQSGFQGYLQLDDNKTKRELANASVQLSTSQATQDSVLPPPSTGMSTGAIVGLSLLGVTVIGLVVYLITKNKNQ